MEQKKFYTVIDQLAKEWYIDANPLVRGTWKNKDGQRGPRRKTNQKGEPNEINTSTGEVQIVSWQHQEQFCSRCSRFVENKVDLVNLGNATIKCSCGLKMPICLDKTMVNSK